MLRKLRILFCILCAVSFLGSCTHKDVPDIPDKNGVEEETASDTGVHWTEYTIVRPDSTTDTVIHAATTLRDGFAALGMTLPLTTDWVNRGEEAPTGTAEILLGDTNRPETAQFSTGLRIGEYTVGYTAGRYVLAAGDDMALTEAVTWLLAHTDMEPTEGVLHTHTVDYRLDGGSLCGNDIADYEILYTADKNGEPDCGTLLQNTVAAQIGRWLPVKKISISDLPKERYQRQILLQIQETQVDGYTVTVNEGGQMCISASDRVQLRGAVLALCQRIEEDTMTYENGTILEGKLTRQSVTLYADAAAATSGDGTKAAPFSTGDALFAGIVALAAKGPYAITVEMTGGDYLLTNTMTLDNTNVGLFGSTISFVCRDATEARFCGWLPVTGFTETTVNGVMAWEAPLPTVEETVLYPNQCFSSTGTRLTRPRYPAGNGELEAVLDRPAAQIPYNESMIHLGYDDATIETFTRLDDIQVHMFHYWNDERLEIAEIDTAKKQLVTKTSPGIAFIEYTHGAPYYLDNVYEMLREPGQFYVDKATGKLLYIPYENESIDGFTLQVSNIDVLLTADGLHGTTDTPALSFTNIGFAGSDWKTTNRASGQAASDIHGAVRLNDVSYVRFDGCSFAHIGDYALEVQKAVSHLDVTHCTFTDLGAGGVTIYGVNDLTPNTTAVNHDITITDNYIGSYGRVHANGIGIVLRYAYDCTLSHNEITDGYYSGISVGWVWGYAEHVTHDILVEKNHIYNIGQYMLSDMGGIYTLGTQPGTVLRGNLIHNVYSRTDKAWGLYTDEGSTDILIENNISYDVKSEAFHQHYGKENIVRNNILAFGRDGIVMVSRLEEHIAIHLEHNILLSDGAPIYLQHPDGMHMADDSNLMWNLSGDVYCSGAKLTVADMQARGLFQNALVADPGFADPKNGDFTLPADSPAYDIGFVDIDMSDVGIRE